VPKLKIGKPATWHTEDTDVPVVIDSIAGSHNGVVYYYVRGTADTMAGKTGVPENELSQKNEKFSLDDSVKQLLKLFGF